VTPEVLHELALRMRERLRDGPPDLRQAYMKLLLNRVEIDRGEIRVSGSKTALERLAAKGASSSPRAHVRYVRPVSPLRFTRP
jgi:hypothetical protein